jgi:DNA-binding NtrC family response regulator
MERPKALVVDEDPAVRRAIAGVLDDHGFDAREARPEAVPALPVDVLVIDAELEAGGLARWTAEQRQLRPGLLVVGLGRDVGAGAEWSDGLTKPLDPARLRLVARRLRGLLALRAENQRLLAELQRRAATAGIVGTSRAARSLRDALARHAASAAPVWLAGEVGVGKQHAARVLHAMSSRSSLEFVRLACAALGDDQPPRDAFDHAFGGTLYLDALPALGVDVQRALARRCETDALGDTGRIVAASSVGPAQAMEEGRLLEALGERFSPSVVVLSPLRERREDVPLLARHFADTIGEVNRLPAFQFEDDALDALAAHPWPGNIAELRGAIEHAALLAADARIGARHLPEAVRDGGGAHRPRSTGEVRGAPRPFRTAKREVVAAFERTYLRDLLSYHGGNVTLAARRAGMLRSALQRLLRKHDLRSGEFRSEAARGGREIEPPPARDDRG